MERLAFLSQEDRVEAADLAFSMSPNAAAAGQAAAIDQPLAEATDRFQMDYINRAIARMKGNVSEAAKLLGIHRSNLYRKMRQLGDGRDGVRGENGCLSLRATTILNVASRQTCP